MRIIIVVFLGAVIYAFNLYKPTLFASAQQATTRPTSTATPSISNSGNTNAALAPGASNTGSQGVFSSPVTVGDLIKAGFTAVKQEVPLPNGRFNGPPLYFSVSDKASDPTSEAPNIVMVDDSLTVAGAISYTYGSNSQAFAIIGGQGKEGTMFDGRIAINFVKNGHYVVVFGPNKQKIEALANLVAQKIR